MPRLQVEGDYEVVCPNSVMGCEAVGLRRRSLGRHLVECKFGALPGDGLSSSLASEEKERERHRVLVAAEVGPIKLECMMRF